MRKPAHNGVPGGALGGTRGELADLLLEVISPVPRQRGNSCYAPEPAQIALVEGIKPRDFRNCHGVRGPFDQHDRVSGLDLALGDDSEIEASVAAGEKSLDDIVAAKSQAKLKAWHSRRRDGGLSGADAKPVANLHGVLPQDFGRQILAEHAPRQRQIGKLVMPKRVVFRRIGVDCLVLAAMHRKVCLTIAVKIEEPQGNPIGNGRFEDRGRNRLALPLYGAREPQIDRDDLH